MINNLKSKKPLQKYFNNCVLGKTLSKFYLLLVKKSKTSHLRGEKLRFKKTWGGDVNFSDQKNPKFKTVTLKHAQT